MSSRTSHPFLGLMALLPLLAVLAGCGGNGGSSGSAPAPPITITAPTYVTAGQPGYGASIPGQGARLLHWNVTGATLTSEPNRPEVTFTPASSGRVQLSCTVTYPTGFTRVSESFSSTIVPPPITPVISAPAYVTAAQAGYAASVPTQANTTYAWAITGGTLTLGATTPTASFTPSGSGSVQLSCIVTNLAGTASTPGDFTSSIVPPPITPVVSAPAFVTAAQAGYSASVPAQANSTYTWSILGGGILAGDTTPTALFTPSGSGSVRLSCVVTNAAGTASTPGEFASTIVPPPVTPIITAPAFVTAAQAGYSSSVPAQADATYAWSITGGTLTTGAATPAVTFTPAGSGSAQLSCVVTNLAGTASTPGEFASTIVPPPITPIITAPAFTIAGQEGYTATTPGAPGNTITWYINGGVFSAGSAGNAITFNPGTGASLALSCISFNQAGTSSAPVGAVVPIAPPPIVPTQQSATLSTLTPAPLPLGLPDLRSTARMSVSLTNRSSTPLLNPQIYPENMPLPYTYEDIVQTLPTGVSDKVLCEAAWRYMVGHYWQYCSAGSPDPDPTDNVAGIFSSINGYGFGCCDQVARYLLLLFSHLGYPSRVAAMPFHTVTEVYYQGAWHMYDVDHQLFYLKRDGQTVASIADVLADPGLILLAADAKGLDPVGWNAQTMADLYVQNAPSLRYATTADYFPPIPLRLQPRETLTLFHENQTPTNTFMNNGIPSTFTDVSSGLFKWNLLANQQTLDQFSYQIQNIQTFDSPKGQPVLKQSGSTPGSLTFARNSPYPLLACQVWACWDGLQGSLTASISTDGATWSPGVPLTPNPERAGYSHAADLTPYVKPRRNYFLRLEFNEGSQVQALALESHVQVSRTHFPLFTNGAATLLHYKDDSPQAQARSILAAIDATPIDDQIQALRLARNTTPGAPAATFTNTPELLVPPGLDPSPSSQSFDFVFTLDQPRLVRKLRADLQDAAGSAVSMSWEVQTRAGADQPWVHHTSGQQDVLDTLDMDTFVTAKEIRLQGTASIPVQFRHLSAFGDPPRSLSGAFAISGLSAYTNLPRQNTSPTAYLVDGNWNTAATSGSTRLDYTIPFVSKIDVSQILLWWGALGPQFNAVGIQGLVEGTPTWRRLGAWAGSGLPPKLAIPVEGRVKSIRLQCQGDSPIGLYEAQVVGTRVP